MCRVQSEQQDSSCLRDLTLFVINLVSDLLSLLGGLTTCTEHVIIESWNHQGWERLLRSSSPSAYVPPLVPTKSCLFVLNLPFLYTPPGMVTPSISNAWPFFLRMNVFSYPAWTFPGTIWGHSFLSSCCYLGEEADPHLSTSSFLIFVESDDVTRMPLTFLATWAHLWLSHSAEC